MKVYKLDGKVINIGEWDYKLTPITNDKEYTPQEAAKLRAIGLIIHLPLKYCFPSPRS